MSKISAKSFSSIYLGVHFLSGHSATVYNNLHRITAANAIGTIHTLLQNI